MSSNKLLLKDKVITKGAGVRRAVLCYDSGLIYQYSDPSNIVGMYQSGQGWIILEKPYYSSGGWGSGSSGDGDGHYLIHNARRLVSAIGGRVYTLNSKSFMTNNEIVRLNKEIQKNNRLIDAQNKIAEKLGRKINEDKMIKIESLRTHLYESGQSAKGIDAVTIAQNYQNGVNVFLEQKGKAIKAGDYIVSKNKVTQGKTVVAFRDAQGHVFMNSQVLNVSRFEREFMGGQSIIQSAIRKIATYSIPFNVLASANLNLNETRVLEQGPESTHQIKKGNFSWDKQTVERHFTGALLLENNGRKFLMDIDREEIEHQIFNAFFVEVDSKVTSIADAYESMKPDEVKSVEAQGIEVLRQGEWFFIPTNKTLKIQTENILESDRSEKRTKIVLKSFVAHGKGRPNSLYKPVGFGDLDQYVCGTVKHTGREHRDLDLGENEVTSSGNGNYTTFKLWKLVPNTTVSNFTITGDVD